MNASHWNSLYASLLMGACLGSAAVSIRMAAAEYFYHLNTRDSVRRAVELEPGDSRYQETWASIEPVEAIPALTRAVDLNPYFTSARLELGLRTEFAGDTGGAEKLLLEAFAHDRMYLPRWTLANFYFRHGGGPRFWKWTRASAEYASQEMTPLFDLCWRTGAPAELILANASPGKAFAMRRYLAYLIATDRLEAAGEVFRRLLTFKESSDSKLLLSLVDKHIAGGEGVAAAGLWNAAAEAGLLAYGRLDPKAGTSLTNGDFHAVPSGVGFDWHPIWNPEALVTRNRVEFSGRQPDQWQVLWQPLVLIPGSDYKLKCRYSTRGIEPGSGLRWRLLGREGASSSLASEDKREMMWSFKAPAEGFARLSLDYRREPGTVPIAGTLDIESVSLELVNSLHH